MNKIKPFENYSSTIFDRNPGDRNQRSIFVSIVSYRDSNIVDTVRSLFENAKRPLNIYVSIAVASIYNHERSWSDEDGLKELIGGGNRVTIKTVDASENFSLGYLRSIADASYNKEMYYMSVSSSTEFDPYWDDVLMKSYDCVYELSKSTNFIFTAIPRYFLRHDDVIEGFVFYTNHKTKISMQREERDSAKIPNIGFSDFINFDDLASPFVLRQDKESAEYIEKLIQSQKDALPFLKKNGFPINTHRDFFDNEVIALSNGFSSKFVFGDARTILKVNPANKNLITEEQNDFMSMLNFIDEDIMMYSLRWTPVYYMPDYSPALSPVRKNVKEMIKAPDQLDNGNNLILQKVDKLSNSSDMEKRENFNAMCRIDWDKKEFKISSMAYNSTVCNSINTMVALYNFSTNENSLHWNRRG